MTTALDSRSLADRVARAPRPHDPAQVPPIAARFADLPATVRALLTGTAGCSPYLAGLMEREAEWLREALAAPPEASLAAILEEAGGHARRFDGSLYRPNHTEGGVIAAGDPGSWQRIRDALWHA